MQTLQLAVLVPLIRNAVLRSRELYADGRTARWENSPQNLQHLFDTYSRRDSRAGGPLRVHPPLKDRRAALTDARNFFTMGFWEMLGVGTLVTLTHDLISLFLSYSSSLPEDAVAVLFAAPLLAAGVGFSVWREAIRSSVTRTPMSVKRAGLGLGIGLALGAAVSPTNSFAFYGTGISPFGVMIPGLMLLFVSGFFIIRWIALVARSWMPVIANRDRPVPIILGTLIAISIPLAIWLDFALMLSPMAHVAQTMAYPHQPAVVVFFITVAVMTLGQPVSVVIPLLLGLAVVPLIGVAWSHRCAVRSSAPHWIALDPLPADWLPPGPNSELRTAIRVGLLSAVGGTLIAQILLAVGGSATTMRDIQVIAGLGQLVAAVLASARTRHLRSLHGIVAAFVAGSIVLLINLIGWRLATGNS